jgi:hypothetical protein
MRHAAVRRPHLMKGQPKIEEPNDTSGLQIGTPRAANASRRRV